MKDDGSQVLNEDASERLRLAQAIRDAPCPHGRAIPDAGGICMYCESDGGCWKSRTLEGYWCKAHEIEPRPDGYFHGRARK